MPVRKQITINLEPGEKIEIGVKEDHSWFIPTQDFEWGDGSIPTTITRLLHTRGYHFVTDVYYGPFGQLQLTITQPLERAMETWLKLLELDSRLEDQQGIANDYIVTDE